MKTTAMNIAMTFSTTAISTTYFSAQQYIIIAAQVIS